MARKKKVKAPEPELVEGEELEVTGFEEGANEDPTIVLPPECSDMEQFELMLRWSSLAYFASQLLSGPPEAPYNGHFLVAPHHLEWSDLVSQHKRLCINASRNHGKSYMFSLAYPLWMAWKNPNRYGLIFSATDEQARRILGDIKHELETNPRLSFMLAEKPKKWNESEIHLANGHVIYAKSFGTKVRGNHPIYAICDDVLNDETIGSEAIRRKQNDYFFSAIVGMMHINDPLIVIGTPFTSADLYGEIQKRKGFHFQKFAALYRDETGAERALWPERFSVSELHYIRDELIGNIRFTREFLCVPVADEMSLFPSWLWQGDPVEQYRLKLGMPREFWVNAGMELYVGVDFALSANVGADYTVITVLALDKFGNRWIVDIRRFHGMPYKQQKSEIVRVGREYDPEIMVLESNQMQRIWGDELIAETDLPIYQHLTGVEKHSLAKGIPSIRMLLDNKKYRVPRGDEHSVKMTDILIEEMAGFTYDKEKVLSVSEHDDCFPAGTKVLTQRGSVAIETITRDDYVWTHKGRWQKVLVVGSRQHVGVIHEVKVAGLPKLLVTENHPFLCTTYKSGEGNRVTPTSNVDWVAVKDLVEGKLHVGHGCLTHTSPTDGEFLESVDLWNYTPYKELPKGGPLWKCEEGSIFWRRDRKFPQHLPVDSEFGFFLGLYLAEGSTGGGGGLGTNRHCTSFGLHTKEGYISEFLEAYARKSFGAKVTHTTRGNVRKCSIASVVLANFLKAFGKSTEKCVPWGLWYRLPKTIRGWVLRGWFVGDGCMVRTKGLAGVSISEQLVEQMRQAAEGLGLRPSVSTYRGQVCTLNRSKGARGFPLNMNKLSLTREDTYFLLSGSSNSVEEVRWGVVPTPMKRSNLGIAAFGDCFVRKVRKVRTLPYDGVVYNLRVEEDESYVANGIVVHNCAMSLYMAEIGIRRMSYTEIAESTESTAQLDSDSSPNTQPNETPTATAIQPSNDDYYPGEDDTPLLPGIHPRFMI